MNQVPRKKKIVIACANALIVMFSTQTFAADENISNVEVQSKTTTEQNLSSEKKREQEIEVIEVTGYAGSVEKALAAKRYSSGVVDSIIAEDIGKMADANVAEALQRMTGVSINRDGGEGTTINIRGLGPSSNQISMNGQTMTGVGAYDSSDPSAVSGGVSFDTMSADMLSRIEVIKTPQAKTVEGSLGGRVNLKSRQPLDSKRTRFTMGIKESYNDLSENVDPSFRMGYIGQFFDDTFGVGINATSERRRGRTDRVNTSGWAARNDITHNYDGFEYMQETSSEDANVVDKSKPLYAYDAANGIIYDGNGEVTNDVDFNDLRSSAQSAHMLEQIQYFYSEAENDRKNFSINLQYKPNDSLSLYTNTVYNRLVTTTDRSILRFNFGGSPFLEENIEQEDGSIAVARGRNGIFSGADFNEDGTVYRAKDLSGIRQTINSRGTLVTDNITGNIGFEFENDRLIISGRVGASIDDQEQLSFNRLVLHSGTQTMGYDTSFDPRLPEFVWGHTDGSGNELALLSGATSVSRLFADVDGADQGLDPGDIRNDYNYATEFGNHTPIRSSFQNLRRLEALNTSAQLDVEYFLDSEVFSSIDFGVYYTKKTTDTYTDSLVLGTTQFDPLFLDAPGASADFPADNFLGQSSDSGSGIPLQSAVTGWAFANYGIINKAYIDAYNEFESDPLRDIDNTFIPITDVTQIEAQRDPSESYTLSETYAALYAQVNVDALEGLLIGDFGLRVVQTKVDTESYAGNRPDVTVAECNNGLTYDRNACLENYSLIEQHNDYFTMLPTANFKYLITNELISRLSIGRTMTRARAHQINPNQRINSNNAETATVFVGNPNIKPTTAWNLDLTLEWYFAKGGILSAGLFHKDIDDFIYTRKALVNGTLIDEVGDVVQGTYFINNSNGTFTEEVREINPYFLQQAVNGDSAEITGLEASYSHKLSFLPGNWSGLGVNFNYTYADSSAIYTGNDANGDAFTDEFSFEGTSKHTVNGSVYWEKYGHSARLSYNYRTDSLRDAVTNLGDSTYTEAYGQMDFSGRYSLSKHLKAGLQVTNLLNASGYSYNTTVEDGSLDGDVYKDRLGNYQFNGRTIRLTIDATF